MWKMEAKVTWVEGKLMDQQKHHVFFFCFVSMFLLVYFCCRIDSG